ncbi:MAG: hypothetical protein COA37_06460 [Hoeflea sp.]|uniref:hypothetical protein n=1 Tax=Hoeflea sp. TaxID=1940281 RepID=UPI000C1023EB|nr:hypothetical protein [Hoeflea sp.]PHR24371.1 MAG: hypothetical protein COA37_06460 [Hoeflea sp.]
MSKVAPKKPEPAPEVDVADIPLPPEERWDDLDNSAATDKAEARPAPRPAVPPARLEFEGSGHERVIPLKHPFKHPETGKIVREITVRRLLTAEVEEAIETVLTEGYSNFVLYARMTGLSVPILRGLMDEDGDAVTDAAYDFLPRVFRTEPAS